MFGCCFFSWFKNYEKKRKKLIFGKKKVCKSDVRYPGILINQGGGGGKI